MIAAGISVCCMIGMGLFLAQENAVHFDFSISLGQIAIVATLVGGFLKFYGPMAQRVWEHDMMWEKFASDNEITPHERVQYRSKAHRAAAGGD